jgi:hypothetical protein
MLQVVLPGRTATTQAARLTLHRPASIVRQVFIQRLSKYENKNIYLSLLCLFVSLSLSLSLSHATLEHLTTTRVNKNCKFIYNKYMSNARNM